MTSLLVRRGYEELVAAEVLLRLTRRRQTAPWRPLPDWAEQHFYVPDTEAPIVWQPHQRAVLHKVFTPDAQGYYPYRTIIYSTPKKGGKTTVAGAVARWVAENWGRFQLVLCVGNDAEQAKERAFAALVQSVELTPGYDRNRRVLPRQWRLLDAEATHLPSGSRVKAIAADYQGEAGANPSLTVYTELWGFIHEAARRFWAEMAPSPTRPNSLRLIETYAGYEGESELLWALYEAVVKEGRQLQAWELGEIGVFEEAQHPEDPVPCFVNEAASIFAYWDSGPQARRMPWQRGERGAQYYANEQATQRPNEYTRLHDNRWASAESSFVPMELWDLCMKPLPLQPAEKTPMVIALDGAVTGDCFGLIMVSRDPERPWDGVAMRMARKWAPPAGGKIDFDGPKQVVRDLCKQYNVVEVAYDPYQLHSFATDLTKEGIAWFREFGQGQERLEADKTLWDLIIQRRLRHDGHPDLREHISNANTKTGKDEDSKLRLIKKAESRKIDLAVCLSMASRECLRLNL